MGLVYGGVRGHRLFRVSPGRDRSATATIPTSARRGGLSPPPASFRVRTFLTGRPSRANRGGRRSVARGRGREREREEEVSEARLGSRGGTTGSPTNLHPGHSPFLPPPPPPPRPPADQSAQQQKKNFWKRWKTRVSQLGKGPERRARPRREGRGRGRPSPKYSEGSGMRGR